MSEDTSRYLTTNELARLRALVLEVGQAEAARRVGCSRAAVLHALAQLESRRGTIVLLRAGLAALDRAA